MTPSVRLLRVLPVLAGTVLAVLATLVAAVATAAPAAARDSLDPVAAALRTSPVYSDPDAESALTGSQVDALVGQIRSGGVPIFLAVLPESVLAQAGGSPQAVATSLQKKVGRNGVYAVVVGSNQFWAGSTNPAKPVAGMASQALAEDGPNGAFAVLTQFVGLAQAAYGATGVTTSTSTGGSGGGGSGWVVLIVLAVIGGGVGLLIWWAVRKGRREAQARFASVRAVVDEDVTAFGERLVAFDISDSRLDDEGRQDLQVALDAYARASDLSQTMKADADAAAVTQQLQEGRYRLACVEARMEGRPLPERRPPCFVDPRHGPSTQDVMWAPSGGAQRSVPVCEACAASITRGLSPQARMVPSGSGGTQPYWQAGRQYGPYASGYYSSFGDVLPALLVGTMIGSMFDHHTVATSSSSMDSGSSDFGGSSADFGGGGGDFGGGDFGGGDFGGGGGDF